MESNVSSPSTRNKDDVDEENVEWEVDEDNEEPEFNQDSIQEQKEKLEGFDFFHKALNAPKHFGAPMVDQSELAFRMLCRKYGTTVCYTPMLHSKTFATNKSYRNKYFTTCPQDRPLVVQFCSNDPQYLLKAAKYVEKTCDAVDINFGCPQRIAKSGRYGAFLMDDLPLVYQLVKTLHDNLKIPVFCKIRIFPEIEKTLEYAKMIESAGCQLLVVHGRTREMKGIHCGLADWKIIKKVKEELKIPVVSNGNIQRYEDVLRCLEATSADGVMSAEGLLRNPALFSGVEIDRFQLVYEYLDMCDLYPTPDIWMKSHVCRILLEYISECHELRDKMYQYRGVLKLRETVKEIEEFVKAGKMLPKATGPKEKNNKEEIENVFVDDWFVEK